MMPVPAFPTIEVTLEGPHPAVDATSTAPTILMQATAVVTASGSSWRVTADDKASLRAGVVTIAVQHAKKLSRAVRVAVAEPEGHAFLAVDAAGHTVPLDATGTPTTDTVTTEVLSGRCWNCRQVTTVAPTYCPYCCAHLPLGLDTVAVTPAETDTVQQLRSMGADVTSSWLSGPPPVVVTTPEIVTTELRPVSPQRGVILPAGHRRLPQTRVEHDPAVWVLGAHGGAGEDTLTALINGARTCAHAWPVDGLGRKARVLLVARTNAAGLAAAQAALIEWSAGCVPDVDLVGVALIADAPGKVPRVLRAQGKHATGAAPRVFELPWVEPWRLGEPVTRDTAPRPYLSFLTTLTPLLQR